MINTYLTNITPDSISGIIFAFEGLKDTVVLLNGPTGCKFYHSATSDNQMIRRQEFDPLNYPPIWYFGQPRVPCSFLDKRDYVYGSGEKIREGIEFLRSRLSFARLIVVNSPGAALIGDELERIVGGCIDDCRVITVESPGYSKYVWDGYSLACTKIIEELLPQPGMREKRIRDANKGKCINILGLSIFHKYYRGSLDELKRLLEMCGISVCCCLACGNDTEELSSLREAGLNVVVDARYGLEAARLLRDKYGTPYMLCDGTPVGFAATEKLVGAICDHLGAAPDDRSRFVTECERARALSFAHISRVNSLTGLPKGTRFAVQGTACECLGYVRFLVDYFGMTADSVQVLDRECASDRENDALDLLVSELERTGMSEAMDRDILDTSAALVFADGNIIASLKMRGSEFTGIETALPSIGYIDVIPKTHFGISGALLICEQVLNGLLY